MSRLMKSSSRRSRCKLVTRFVNDQPSRTAIGMHHLKGRDEVRACPVLFLVLNLMRLERTMRRCHEDVDGLLGHYPNQWGSFPMAMMARSDLDTR